MSQPEDFDAFYLDARERLLLQTYALTGDLGASRSAVRDTFVVAWHHWRKVGALPDREDWTRPHAWLHAQRRHTARVWHRDKELDPDVSATLATLSTLTAVRRRLLLLDQLTDLSASERAREVGLTRVVADTELRAALASFCQMREVTPAGIAAALAPLGDVVARVAWPRPSTVRHTGAARRRTHTLLGAATAVTALLVSGSLVTDAAGVRPTLAREVVAAPGSPEPTPEPEPDEGEPEEEAVPQLDASRLLTPSQVRDQLPGTAWRVTGTHDNTEGDGLVTACQRTRFADPDGTAALVRTFGPPAAKTAQGKAAQGKAARKQRRQAAAAGPAVVETIEASASGSAARQTMSTTTRWYAACAAERVQLLSTSEVTDIGHRARVIALRSWTAPVSTMTVGIARTGRLTVTTMTTTPGPARPDLTAQATLLARAVNDVCKLPESGPCATGTPQPRTAAPVATGSVPALLSVIDLPPVGGVRRPWVGTDPVRATDNVAATQCDRTSFSGRFEGRPLTRNLTRSFLIPGARLPDEFGLTETVAALPGDRASSFVEGVRARLRGCEDDNPGTEVVQVEEVRGPDRDLTVWHVTTEVSDQRSVRYLMAIMRSGTSVAQLGFVPAPGVEMPAGAFIALAQRALARLDELPGPAAGGAGKKKQQQKSE